MDRSTDIYLSSDGIIRIVTRGTTDIGCPIWYGPVYLLKNTDSPKEIGIKAIKALHDFQEKAVPHPKNQDEWKLRSRNSTEHLKLNSSWRTFLKNGAKCLSLVLNKDKITIWPTRNNIAANIKSGLEATYLEQKNRISTMDPQELGATILDAFNDCE